MKIQKQVLQALSAGIEVMINDRKNAAKTPQILAEIVVLSTVNDWANAGLKRKSLTVKTNEQQAAALLWFFQVVDLFENPYLAAHLYAAEQHITNLLISHQYKL